MMITWCWGTASRHHEAESGAINEGKVLSSISPGGKACDQPKRTPLSQQEIEAILVFSIISISYSWFLSGSDEFIYIYIFPHFIRVCVLFNLLTHEFTFFQMGGCIWLPQHSSFTILSQRNAYSLLSCIFFFFFPHHFNNIAWGLIVPAVFLSHFFVVV